MQGEAQHPCHGGAIRVNDDRARHHDPVFDNNLKDNKNTCPKRFVNVHPRAVESPVKSRKLEGKTTSQIYALADHCFLKFSMSFGFFASASSNSRLFKRPFCIASLLIADSLSSSRCDRARSRIVRIGVVMGRSSRFSISVSLAVTPRTQLPNLCRVQERPPPWLRRPPA
jgi:hypothetical protein